MLVTEIYLLVDARWVQYSKVHPLFMFVSPE